MKVRIVKNSTGYVGLSKALGAVLEATAYYEDGTLLGYEITGQELVAAGAERNCFDAANHYRYFFTVSEVEVL